MAKGISDIIGDITRPVARDGDTPMAEMAGPVHDMEKLLETLTETNREAAARLAPVLEQARAMSGVMEKIVAAEAEGGSEEMLALSSDFAAIGAAPGYEPETDPQHKALQEALDRGDDAALTAVLDSLGDLNCYVGQYEQTPLGLALGAPGRSAARVAMFLDRGARAEFATPEGYTPLHEIGGYPWSDATPDTPGELAAIVTRLVAAGGDLQARTRWGWTPLVRAAFEGSALEMRALLAAGADPNVAVGDGEPSAAAGNSLLLLVAAEPEKVALLLDFGADAAKAGVEAYIGEELADEEPEADADYYAGLHESRRLIRAARRQ